MDRTTIGAVEVLRSSDRLVAQRGTRAGCNLLWFGALLFFGVTFSTQAAQSRNWFWLAVFLGACLLNAGVFFGLFLARRPLVVDRASGEIASGHEAHKAGDVERVEWGGVGASSFEVSLALKNGERARMAPLIWTFSSEQDAETMAQIVAEFAGLPAGRRKDDNDSK